MYECPADRRWTAVAVALLLALVAGACGSDASSSSEAQGGNAGVVEETSGAQAGGSLVYGLEAESDGWNPSNSKWAPSGLMVARAVFDTLTAYDADLNAQPFLAESLTPNSDYTQWTITLRPDITLHNGRPVDAGVVKANFEYLKASTLTSSAFEPVDSFETSGPLDVIVNMNRPWVNYPFSLATQIGVVSDPEWLTTGSKDHPIGTGPFVFQQWVPDSKLTVTKNAEYWQTDAQGTRLPYLDEVEFRPLPDNDSRSASLQAGGIDAMMTSDPDQILKFEDLAEKDEFQVFNDVSGETAEAFIQLNTMAPPFDDPDARRALALATDTKAYVDIQTRGLNEPARGPFAPSSPWYTETTYPEYDKDAAKELVEQVKATHGGSFTFRILGGSDASSLSGLQLLQDQWREVGIDAQITPSEQAKLITDVALGNYQATAWRQFDSPHPLGDSIWWHPNTAEPIGEIALNFARNKDERIGAALDAARETPDKEQEKLLYRQVQEYLAEDIPYVWLYHTQISVIASPSLVNVVNYTLPNGQKGIELQGGSHPLYQVWRRS
jgi:peptide/nickel transport system substrate-binding protein